MESSQATPGHTDAAAARAALEDVTAVRARVARRIVSPWWYHWGMGAAVAFWFVSMSFRFASYGAPIAFLAVFALSAAHKRATGVVFRHDKNHYGGVWVLGLVAALGIGMYLEYGQDLFGAIAVAGVILAALTVVVGYRMDAAARRDLQPGS